MNAPAALPNDFLLVPAEQHFDDSLSNRPSHRRQLYRLNPKLMMLVESDAEVVRLLHLPTPKPSQRVKIITGQCKDERSCCLRSAADAERCRTGSCSGIVDDRPPAAFITAVICGAVSYMLMNFLDNSSGAGDAVVRSSLVGIEPRPAMARHRHVCTQLLHW
ncbi:hypothetical protein [Stutzerimonas xanthomarina]|uniref:hypothetical protein n=1 Tax=Stutzerimonas xanthomarina TaxID=271420 RepID=UPI003AA84301